MTDLYDEWWTQKAAMTEACLRGGDVLITGLGLALVVDSILRSPDSKVETVTVVEASEEVINLVGPHVLARLADRLEIVQGSAFDWDPPVDTRYSVIWHDIWDNPQDVAVEREIQTLEGRYASFCDWQGSWPRDYLAAVDESTQQLGGW
jgi:spermidine synthase